ncbi:MAG TPA: YraN family protein [Woeseiaceae bacterium]|nr:YraN family protein [Woeseiaceae bacterium]
MHAKGIRGRRAEELALRHLESQGLALVAKNFRCRLGEIDLVMRMSRSLVFVEVRSRASSRFASPLESVDWRKQQKLIRAASYFLMMNRAFRHHAVRFDVVAVEGPLPGGYSLQWIRDAFRPQQ